MQVELVKQFVAEAAHANDKGLHGHSYRIDLVVRGETDPALGWLIDFGRIKCCFAPLYDQLDHRFLNEVDGMADTSLAGVRQWIRARLEPDLPGLADVRVGIEGACEFRPETVPADADAGLPARVRMTFEAAQSLPDLPEGHPCRELHGHTYRVEVGASDLGCVREALRGLYDALDHRYLNEVAGLESATSERMCQWIWDRVAPDVPGLEVVVVQETATARCVYYGA